jgi:Holliday junction resolvase RusA-like endonuclease
MKFTVPGKPIGTNAAYRAGKGRYYLTKDAKAFKERLRAYAVLAKNTSGWKMLTGKNEQCSVRIIVWNSRHDADSPIKFCLDSLQGVIFENDRYVKGVESWRGVDESGPRIDIEVEPV